MSVFFRLGLFCARRRWVVIACVGTRAARLGPARAAGSRRIAIGRLHARRSRGVARSQVAGGHARDAAVGDGHRAPEHDRRASRRSGFRGCRRRRPSRNVPQAAHVAGLLPHTLTTAPGQRRRQDRLRDRRARPGARRLAAGARAREGRARAHAGRDGDAGRRARVLRRHPGPVRARPAALRSSSRCRWPRSRCCWSSAPRSRAGVPIVVGGTAVVIALAVIFLAAQQTPLSIFVLNLATLLGLGLGVDYALLTDQPIPRRAGQPRPAPPEGRTESTSRPSTRPSRRPSPPPAGPCSSAA